MENKFSLGLLGVIGAIAVGLLIVVVVSPKTSDTKEKDV